MSNRKLMSIPQTTADLSTTSTNLQALIDGHHEDTGGLLRLAPDRVPRSFLQPDAPAIEAYRNA